MYPVSDSLMVSSAPDVGMRGTIDLFSAHAYAEASRVMANE